jgi:serine/threonine protein kinase
VADEPRPFGPFVLLKALGRGAMGDVHLARPYNPNRGIPTPIVVKRLHGELAHKKGFVSRFRHEATIAVSVESAHVAKVFDVGSVGETLYIVMEYVEGWPLSKVLDAILKSGRHASIASVIDSIAGGLIGLDILHTARDPETNGPLGIVHRDISPKNLMIGEDGLMRLIDLGLGKSNAQDWKTRTGVVMGSVGYMPPEQAAGEHVDARADVYAMGVVAFEMLALRNFIKRGPLPQMMENSARPKFTKPSDFRPDVPDGLDEVLQRALEPNKDERFQSSREFLDALRSIVPSVHTDGGMASLVDELFGETRIERRREMEALLRLPLPIEDPGDFEPTRVFVRRAGVGLPDERHMEPTKVAVADYQSDGPTVPPTVATEVRWNQGPQASLHGRAPVGSDTTPDAVIVFGHEKTPPSLSAPAPSPASRIPPAITGPQNHGHASHMASATHDGQITPLITQQIVTRPGGVSMSVLIFSVLIAGLVGAVVAVVVSQSIISGSNGVVSVATKQAETEIEPSPSVAVHPAAASDRVAKEEPSAPEEALASPKPPQRKRIDRVVKAHHEPVPQTAAAEDREREEKPAPETKASLDARCAALVKRADSLIAGLPDGPKKEKLFQFKALVGMNSAVQDVERLRKNVADLERQLRAIEGS